MTTSTGTRAASSTALLSSLAGLTALGVLLQGLWAGLFLPAGKGGTYQETWVEVHSWGGRLTLLLALATSVVAFVRHRDRRDLTGGSIVLLLLLVIENGLGPAISDSGSRAAAVVHVPLALVIMSIAVWLPLRARHAGRG